MTSIFKTLYPRVPHSEGTWKTKHHQGSGCKASARFKMADACDTVYEWLTISTLGIWGTTRIPGLCVLSRSTRGPTVEASSKLWVIFDLSNHKITNIKSNFLGLAENKAAFGFLYLIVAHFTVTGENKTGVDLVLIQNVLLYYVTHVLLLTRIFKHNVHKKRKEVCIKTRSTSASRSLKG